MFAVYLASSSFDGLWLLVALCVAGGAAGFLTSRSRRLVLALLVLGVLAYATSAYAQPYYYCDPLWRWLGIC